MIQMAAHPPVLAACSASPGMTPGAACARRLRVVWYQLSQPSLDKPKEALRSSYLDML